MLTEVKNNKLIITIDIDERVSSTGKTFLVASETARDETYKGKDNMKVQVNATIRNPDYVKPTAAEKVVATKAEIAKLQEAIA